MRSDIDDFLIAMGIQVEHPQAETNESDAPVDNPLDLVPEAALAGLQRLETLHNEHTSEQSESDQPAVVVSVAKNESAPVSETTDTAEESTETPAPQSLSSEDVSDILNEFGFDTSEASESDSTNVSPDDVLAIEAAMANVLRPDDHTEEDEEETDEEEEDSEDDWEDVDEGEDEDDVDMEISTDANSPEIHPDAGGSYYYTNGSTIATWTARDISTSGGIPVASSAPETPEGKLPENSKSLLLDDSTSRFSGADWYELAKEQRIIIAGMGGIGSNAAYQIARLCPATLCLYDDDIVEVANMSGQLFCRQDIGSRKVDAVAAMIRKYSSITDVRAIGERFTHNSAPCDIMICGFDNMAARKMYFESWMTHVKSYTKKSNRANCIFIDGRLSMSVLQVFCITGDDTYNQQIYQEKHLFSDAEADQTVCSLKQTTYLACMIGSVITNMLINWIANRTNPVIPYDVPFFIEYDAQNVLFKTEN